MKINLNYVHGSAIGYGRYGVKLAAALKDLGVEVFDDMPGPVKDKAYLDEDITERHSGLANVVCWVSTPSHARGWHSSQYPVISTMWEAQHIPEQFRENLHNFELVIVPSYQNLELFSQYHKNVKMVPLGIDPKDWHFVPREIPQGEFRFLVAGSGPRKGTDLVHKAFKTLWGKEGSWGDGPVPNLIMKNPRNEPFHGDRVHVIGGRLSDDEEQQLYATSHCYVQPARGEGFGLQPLQAIAQGMPTVLTKAHGHDSFAHLGLPISATPAKASYFIYGDAGDWWEPNFDELCDRMKWVYDNYGEACAQASNAAKRTAQVFTWNNTAASFMAAIGREKLEAPFQESEWFTPDAQVFRVVTLKDWTADIAGTKFFFKKGQEYWENADVKRILFEAQLLDPSCVEDTGDAADTGLTVSQNKQILDYSARNSHCETCGQRLNSKPTKSDELLEMMSKA